MCQHWRYNNLARNHRYFYCNIQFKAFFQLYCIRKLLDHRCFCIIQFKSFFSCIAYGNYWTQMYNAKLANVATRGIVTSQSSFHRVWRHADDWARAYESERTLDHPAALPGAAKASCKTIVSPMRQQWGYNSLAQHHRYVYCNIQFKAFFSCIQLLHTEIIGHTKLTNAKTP